jgi:hypothetical protein
MVLALVRDWEGGCVGLVVLRWDLYGCQLVVVLVWLLCLVVGGMVVVLAHDGSFPGRRCPQRFWAW